MQQKQPGCLHFFFTNKTWLQLLGTVDCLLNYEFVLRLLHALPFRQSKVWQKLCCDAKEKECSLVCYGHDDAKKILSSTAACKIVSSLCILGVPKKQPSLVKFTVRFCFI